MDKREWVLSTLAAILVSADERLSADDCSALPSRLAQWYDAVVASTPEEPAWIEHRGEKPYPEGMVEVMFRNGRVDSGDADEFLWTHDEDLVGSVIVRWRPA